MPLNLSLVRQDICLLSGGLWQPTVLLQGSVFFAPSDLLFSVMKIMVIWTQSFGEGEQKGWFRSREWQSSAKTGHVGVIEVNHRTRYESRNGYLWVISKDFQAPENCLLIYSGEQNIEQLACEAEGTTKHQINLSRLCSYNCFAG